LLCREAIPITGRMTSSPRRQMHDHPLHTTRHRRQNCDNKSKNVLVVNQIGRKDSPAGVSTNRLRIEAGVGAWYPRRGRSCPRMLEPRTGRVLRACSTCGMVVALKDSHHWTVEGDAMSATWGLCKKCKWWQIEPDAAVADRTTG